MKCRRIRGIAPLLLCATTAARVSLAGRSTFARCAFLSATPTRGVGAAKIAAAVAQERLYARIIASSGHPTSKTACRHSTTLSESPAVIQPQDDLDERVKTVIAGLPRRPRCAVVGGGFAGLATAYHLAAFGSEVTVFDRQEVGTGGASAVAAGLLHPLTPRGKLIWKGEEGLAAAKEMIKVRHDVLGDKPSRMCAGP